MTGLTKRATCPSLAGWLLGLLALLLAVSAPALAEEGTDVDAVNALVHRQMGGEAAGSSAIQQVSGQAYIDREHMDAGTISQALGALMDAQQGGDSRVAVQRAPRINFEIHFLKNSAELTEDSQRSLDELARSLEQDYPDLRFVLGGHTDQDGDDVVNQPLSQARAESARRYLVEEHAVAPERVEARGFGSDDPLRPVEASPQDKLYNRRVDLRPVF